jgi:undecaprenol kinase
MKNKPFYERLLYALGGLRETWSRERSFRTHVTATIAVCAVVLVLRPGWLWTGLVAITITLVLALELMNSAVEYLIDHLHPEIAPEIKLAKDVAAGAVLIASIGAVAIGALLVASLLWP